MTGYRIARRGGVWYTHAAFGPLLTMLSEHVRKVHFHAPLMPEGSEPECDSPLDSPSIEVTPWPARVSSMHELRHPLRVLRQYRRLVRCGTVVFLRGGGPFMWAAHLMARRARKPVVHWLISNPIAAVSSQPRRSHAWMNRMGSLYARLDVRLTRFALRMSRAEVLANGEEVARLYGSPRTRTIVSTSIRRADFRAREDTCDAPGIRLLFVGYIRPEKGIEYLLRSLPLLRSEKPIQLALVGSADQFPGERRRLGEIAEELGLAARVHWEGHVPLGEPLFSQLDRSDVLVLPSLSEGTPRVLVEARARSLPIVSTNVGGIPSSVTDGIDGLLVPPRNPTALATAIQKVLDDAPLRRQLIRAGRQRVEPLTLENFVGDLVNLLSDICPKRGGG